MILSGKPVAENIYKNIKKDLEALWPKKLTVSMGVVLVGEDPASLTYVKIKEKIADRLGIGFKLFHLPNFVSEKEVIKLIKDLNQNKYITGIVIQLPLPQDFQIEKILKLIASQKDIDGFFGKYPPPTAQAILEILKFYKISLKGQKIVILGYGRLVGQPLEKLLKKQGLKPIVCDSKTKNLNEKLKLADIIITATGVHNLIRSSMVNKEVIIIDAGISEANGKMIGDLNPQIYSKIKAYTPVPGGVGPVTVACLMRNLVEAAKTNIPIK